MEWDIYETLKEEKRRDARRMYKIASPMYACMDDAWSDAYDAIRESEKEDREEAGKYVPDTVASLAVLISSIIGTFTEGNGEE